MVRRIKPRTIARYDGPCHLGEGSALLPRDIFRSGSFSAGARHRIPFNDRAGAEQAVVRRPQEVSTDSEERLHDPVHRRESLELSGRREPSHLALPRSCRVMRDLRASVRVLISDVDHRRYQALVHESKLARHGPNHRCVIDRRRRTLGGPCRALHSA